jgi:methionyl aminopeptidase
MISIKTAEEIERMRESGDLMKGLFPIVEKEIREGMTTKELDRIVFEYIKSCGANAPCINYQGYPAATCISIDEMVVHGIPSDNVFIREGQIVSLDVVLEYNGYMADATRTFMIGDVSDEKKKLVKVTEECFFKAVENLCDGTPIGNIGYNVQTHAEANGFSVIRAFTGHGIGKAMHEDPSIPNYGRRGTGIRLKSGMVVAIEPMIAAGTFQVDFCKDGWGAVTRDRRPVAHYENTVLITENGAEILTL